LKILTVIGARPQFIKASVVSRAIAEREGTSEIVVHTGQHFDDNMSDVFFDELDIAEPKYHLEIRGGTHGVMTGRMLAEVESVMLAERPDAVLVYGDTNSTLAGALAAAKLHIPVAHVEAGLRSFDMRMPEEVNRVVTDRVSTWLFTPTDAAARNLEREGYASDHIVPVGDVMYDVALHYGARARSAAGIIGTLGLAGREFALVTVHRAENTDSSDRLSRILDAVEAFADEMPVVWPMHPRTRAVVESLRRTDSLARHVTVIDPVGYLDMTRLTSEAALVVTDSGGLQKEAFFHRVPCVTLRDSTEWVELVEAGWNRVVPPVDTDSVVSALRAARTSQGAEVTPYGTGHAAHRIVDHLITALSRT
jgi:UDP-GlcNAc3NAcA epimerase